MAQLGDIDMADKLKVWVGYYGMLGWVASEMYHNTRILMLNVTTEMIVLYGVMTVILIGSLSVEIVTTIRRMK